MYGSCLFTNCIVVAVSIFLEFMKAETILNTAPNPDINIALKKPARSAAGNTSVANDGNMDPNWPSRSCFNTNTPDAKGYWWQVDLEDDVRVGKVKITNRADCCPGRLRDFSVDVFTSDPVVNPTTPAKHCTSYTGAVNTPGITLTLECLTSVSGRFLRLTQLTQNLQFCELQVFADVSGRYEPCGWFTQYRGKRSGSSQVTPSGPEISNRAECAEQCGRDLTCTAFNFRYQPEVTCEFVNAPDGGSKVNNVEWDLYVVNPCWKKCDD